MKYVKIGLIIVAVFVLAVLLTVVVRVIREVIISSASALHALGDLPVAETWEEEPPPTGGETVLEYGKGGGAIDPGIELVPGVVHGNVVYATADLDLFEVPVDVEADMLAPDAG